MTDRGLGSTVAHLRAMTSEEEARKALAEAATQLAADGDDGGGHNNTISAQAALALIGDLAIDHAKLRADLNDATRAREVLLANVAHDLRNPLNTFAMSAGLLRDDLEGPEFDRTRALNLLSRMDRASARMQALIEDLLEASRIAANAIEINKHPEQASVIARAAVAKAKAQVTDKGAALDEGPIADDAIIECDKTRAAQALEKLVLLALKSTGEGGSIRVGVEADETHVHFIIGATPPRGTMNPQAFDDSRGGLALLIARGLIAAQGGTLSIAVVPEGPRIHATFARAKKS